MPWLFLQVFTKLFSKYKPIKGFSQKYQGGENTTESIQFEYKTLIILSNTLETEEKTYIKKLIKYQKYTFVKKESTLNCIQHKILLPLIRKNVKLNIVFFKIFLKVITVLCIQSSSMHRTWCMIHLFFTTAPYQLQNKVWGRRCVTR